MPEHPAVEHLEDAVSAHEQLHDATSSLAMADAEQAAANPPAPLVENDAASG